MRPLYEIAADIKAIDDLLDEADEADGVAADILAKFWDESEGALKAKIDGMLRLERSLLAQASMRTAEANRLDALARRDTNKARRIVDSIKEHLETIGLSKIETELFSIAVVANGGAQPVVIDDAMTIPEGFFRHPPPVLDRTAIAKALSAGETVPGVHLGVRGRRLRVS